MEPTAAQGLPSRFRQLQTEVGVLAPRNSAAKPSQLHSLPSPGVIKSALKQGRKARKDDLSLTGRQWKESNLIARTQGLNYTSGRLL